MLSIAYVRFVLLNTTLISLAVLLLVACQSSPKEEFVVGGQSYRKSDFNYVEQVITVSSYQFPRQSVGELGIAQVELRAERLSAESVSLRGTLAPQMDELAVHYRDWSDLKVFSIDFLDEDGVELAHQDVTFDLLIPTTHERYSFSIDADIDADRFDGVESIVIGWAQLLDDAVAAYLESEEGKTWTKEH